MKAEASNNYGVDLLEKMGFESVSQTCYGSVLGQDCKPIIAIKDPNSNYQIMVKKLS